MHGMKWLRGALVLPKSLSSSVVTILLGLAVAWAACGPAVLVNGQDGFISIDCGTSEANLSGNISWLPDSNYIVLGSASNVKNATLPYDTLRYFPNKAINKSCYVFKTTANSPYLVRAGFLYGNYDNLSVNGLPSFDLLFDSNLWTNVSFNDVNEIVSHEMIVLAMGENTSVCVARSNTDYDPFISSLEIRPLSTNVNMYSPVHQNFLMKTNSRINFGQNNTKSVRYPDDEYDRIWDSDLEVVDGISLYIPISTNNNVTIPFSSDSPPSKVMQTARSVNNKTENMTFNFVARFGPGKYYLAFYFAEIVKNESQRIMDIYIDKELIHDNLNWSSPVGLFSTIEIYNANYTVTGESYELLLMPSKNSSSGPIINAAESYFLQRGDQGTLDQDVQALENIKTAFNLSLWTGDPCLPNASKWSWLDCNSSASPARVIALDLSSRGLRSEIPSGIGNLTALTSVDLHNNSLFGNIPSFLERLNNLTFLDLSNNNLSGEYPSGFSNHTTVRITGNPLLCFNTSCGVTPAPAPAPLQSSSAKDTGLIVGLVLAGFLVLVMAVSGLTLYRHKSRKKQKLFMTNSAHWPPVPPFTEISRAGDSVVSAWKEGSNDAPIYSFSDMQIITNNFEKKLTAGSFGSLFYGTLSGGQEVVVKLLQSNIQQSPNDFLKKVSHLSYVNHRNLLRPTGFCAESHRFMFVYEHVQKGSLYDHLYNADNQCLDWRTRLNILQQVAQGLEYLHCVCTPSIVHGNLKSTNVLMSGDGMLAKVSDFGIYELSPNVDATSGYLDPEYFAINKLTKKSDVYSFGVLILEVMCGRVPFDTSLPKEAWNIVDWVRNALHEENYELIADPGLHGSYNMIALSKVAQLALQATKININERPTIGEIAMELKEANKIELGHHVAFAELATSDFPNSSDFPLPSTCPNVLCEADVSD